jgi:glyoxylase-like metal-dependent hydrolase (beta-lactamase superfamily II)
METSEAELIDVVPGLWIWQVEYREWPRGQGWDGKVVSTCVESGGEIALLDPLAPENESSALWERLAARPPKFIVILKPDHMRDVDFFSRRYNIRAFGPKVFHRDDIPETELEYIYPGITLPGGFVTLYDGRNNNETPIWLPEQRTIVFADSLTAPHGELLVWSTPWHKERVLPALRDLLKLPFERVIVSHGDPVHTRSAFEQALELPPWDPSD